MEHKDILENWEEALKNGIRQSFVESLYKKNHTPNNKKRQYTQNMNTICPAVFV